MYDFRNKAIDLRKAGKTYSEIATLIPRVSKSTLSSWLSKVELSKTQKDRISKNINKKLVEARTKSQLFYKQKREQYFNAIEQRNSPLLMTLENNKEAAKLVLSALYLGEGAKTRRGSMQIGNSDPGIIKLFLKLFRLCYDIEEAKFRCTVLCRADQNIKSLEKFWRQITGIPKDQFYKARVDARTIGKPSKKLDYKGVCVIDYLSAQVYYDLLTLGKMLSR